MQRQREAEERRMNRKQRTETRERETREREKEEWFRASNNRRNIGTIGTIVVATLLLYHCRIFGFSVNLFDKLN